MKPITFKGCNTVMGEQQEEYQDLPAMRFNDRDGTVLFCWYLSWRERLKVLLTGQVWHYVLTFHKPLQPQLLVTEPAKSDEQNQ